MPRSPYYRPGFSVIFSDPAIVLRVIADEAATSRSHYETDARQRLNPKAERCRLVEKKPIENAKDARPPAPAKKPYQKPELLHWGTLLEMTQAVGQRGRRDGGRSRYAKKTRY
jgi:hypothetical protein